jgi:hypothetical protein
LSQEEKRKEEIEREREREREKEREERCFVKDWSCIDKLRWGNMVKFEMSLEGSINEISQYTKCVV